MDLGFFVMDVNDPLDNSPAPNQKLLKIVGNRYGDDRTDNKITVFYNGALGYFGNLERNVGTQYV
jgi:hypothetical protein